MTPPAQQLTNKLGLSFAEIFDFSHVVFLKASFLSKPEEIKIQGVEEKANNMVKAGKKKIDGIVSLPFEILFILLKAHFGEKA